MGTGTARTQADGLTREAGPARERARETAGDSAARGVFLTPRVLDRRVYDEMVASLTALIERAEGETKRASGTAGAVGELRGSLREAAKALGETVRRGQRASDGLDEKLARAAELLGRAEQTLAGAVGPAVEKAVGETVRRAIESAEARIAAREREAVARIEGAEQKLRLAMERASETAGGLQERFERQADAALAQVEAAAKRLGPAELAALVARGEALVERVEETGLLLAQLRDQAGEAKRTLGESLLDQAATVDRLLERQEALGREMTRLQSVQAEHEMVIDEHLQRLARIVQKKAGG